MVRTSHALIELVNALNDGVAFYDTAMAHARDPIVSDMFFRLSRGKRKIAAQLSEGIARPADAGHRDGTWVAALRHAYSDIAAGMAANPTANHLARAAAQEDRVLDAFQLAAASDPSERVRSLVTAHLADVQRLHAEIHQLRHSRAA